MTVGLFPDKPGFIPGFFMTFRRLLASALLLLCPLGAVNSKADNARSILVRSVGGPEALARLETMTTSVSEGDIRLNSQSGRFRQFFKAPNRLRLEIDFGTFRIVQGFDGRRAWQIDMTGAVSQLHGFEKAEILKNIFFESVSYLLEPNGDRYYDFVGPEALNGVDYYKFRFFPGGIDTVTTYFVKSDSSKSMIIDYLDNLEVITRLFDQRRIDGVIIPFRTVAEVEMAGLTTEIIVDTCIFDLPLADSLFAMPQRGEHSNFFPPDLDSIQFRFDYFGGHIRIQGNVNGKRLWFILDSGASATMINRASVADLEFKVLGALPARGVSEFADVDLVLIDSINIDAITIFDVKAGLLDLSRLNRRSPKGGTFGGLVGYDFLSQFPTLIDYDQELITVYNPISFVPPDSAESIGFQLNMQVPTVEASVNGHKGRFLIDLGNSLGLLVHNRFAKKTKLVNELADLRSSEQQLAGITGSMTTSTGMADSVIIGSIRLDSMRVILPDSAAGVTGSEELAGNFGNMVLENFRVLLDYDSSRLWLLPPSTR